jgi:glycolate oxidase
MNYIQRIQKKIKDYRESKHLSDNPLVADLQKVLDRQRVLENLNDRISYSKDESVFEGGIAGPVCFPLSTKEVQAIMKVAEKHERHVIPRGAGSGLAGGAIPLGAPIVIAMTKMNNILEIDIDNRIAWVEPGVINLELSDHLRPLGFHYAPDPSSQQICTLGGNVANNSGGPHCLADGVTDTHVIALEVVLPNGDITTFGGIDAEPTGLDLRGAFIGSEGTLGITTKIAVRLTPNPEDVQTILISFPTMRKAAETVSAVIADGIVPAAMEAMDQRTIEVIEQHIPSGYPSNAGAVLLVEVEGLPAGVEIEALRICEIAENHEAGEIKIAQTSYQRDALWKGRKSAFGASTYLAPNYYLHDTVVPRSELANVLDKVNALAEKNNLTIMNVFHAGDGNLHPLLVFDANEEGTLARVHEVAAEIVKISLDAGGVLSGEHGIGIEKQEFMSQLFTDADLDHQNKLRTAFDPQCRINPGKVLPTGHSCADIQTLNKIPEGTWV